MSIAIETHYVGPSNTKGGRIVARAENHRLTISYPHELSGEAVHRKAAEALANKLGWLANGERLISGWTPRGYVFVFLHRGDPLGHFSYSIAP